MVSDVFPESPAWGPSEYPERIEVEEMSLDGLQVAYLTIGAALCSMVGLGTWFLSGSKIAGLVIAVFFFTGLILPSLWKVRT